MTTIRKSTIQDISRIAEEPGTDEFTVRMERKKVAENGQAD